MSTTYNYIYNPVPPRAWSRVQTRCTYTDPSSNYAYAYIPLTNQTVSLAQANYEDKLLYKGNILQYKGNSSQLTKKQKYSQLTKGLGPNRTKVFATQSETYTNPNTTGLLRVNTVTYPFPNQLVGKPNNISGPFQYNVKNPYNCPTNSVEDGGNLVCGTYANPCSKEIIKVGKIGPLCFPNTFSDVPGSPIELCWNPKVQTWFPRQRYFMNNSTNKWPEGYKGFVSALRPEAPKLTLVASSDTSVTLSWNNVSNKCIPISSYNIYQNGRIVQNVPYSVTSTKVNTLNTFSLTDKFYSFNITGNNNTFYVTALSSNISSSPSNIVTQIPLYTVEGLTYTEITPGTIKILQGNNGTITFNYNVLFTEILLVGGGNSGNATYNTSDGGIAGGWGGAGGGYTIEQNISIENGQPITLTVGQGGVYGVNSGQQSSLLYNSNKYYSQSNGNNWKAAQNNSGGLNYYEYYSIDGYNTKNPAQDGLQYYGIWYCGGGGYGGNSYDPNNPPPGREFWYNGGVGGKGGGGGGGGINNIPVAYGNGGNGGGGNGGSGGISTSKTGKSNTNGGGGGYTSGSGGNGDLNSGNSGGGTGGLSGGRYQGGGGGGGGVNTGGGGGGGGVGGETSQGNSKPGNGGSGIIIIKYSIT